MRNIEAKPHLPLFNTFAMLLSNTISTLGLMMHPNKPPKSNTPSEKTVNMNDYETTAYIEWETKNDKWLSTMAGLEECDGDGDRSDYLSQVYW